MFTSVCISPLLFITKVHVRKLHCCFQNYLNPLNGCIAEKTVRQRNPRLITTLLCLSSNLVLSYKYPFQSVKVFQGNPHEFNIALGKSFNFFVDQVGGPVGDIFGFLTNSAYHKRLFFLASRPQWN